MALNCPHLSVPRRRKEPLMTNLSSKELRQLRGLAHSLKPVVIVAGKGLAPAVLDELDRALNDHELIKVKVSVGDREQRESIISSICQHSGAHLIQRIGNIATLLRSNPQADPRKSNLHRNP